MRYCPPFACLTPVFDDFNPDGGHQNLADWMPCALKNWNLAKQVKDEDSLERLNTSCGDMAVEKL